MRALRDFNIPKIVTDDVPVFMGLIGDLFPALDVPRKRDMEFERTVKQAALDLLLQPEDNFILKVRNDGVTPTLNRNLNVFHLPGRTARRTSGSSTLSFRRRKRRYRKDPSMEKSLQNIPKREKKTDLQRFESQSRN